MNRYDMTHSPNKNKYERGKSVGASEFVTEAYNLDDPDNTKAFYAKWADDYDNQMTKNLNYVSPKLIAQSMQQFLTEKDAEIIDIGCGTGLTAKEMAIAGYTNLYGVDLSREMIDVAANRNIYQGLSAADINNPLKYEDNTFDGAISSGTFTHGHVGPEPLPEIFRILKPNGILACTVHQDLWQACGFERTFNDMADCGKISCLSLKFDRYYEDANPEGWFCVYQKIAETMF